jgi:hypothetical protein
VLKAVTPYDKDGEPGLRHILDAENVDAWVEANAADLLAAGYVRVLVNGCVGSAR